VNVGFLRTTVYRLRRQRMSGPPTDLPAPIQPTHPDRMTRNFRLAGRTLPSFPYPFCLHTVPIHFPYASQPPPRARAAVLVGPGQRRCPADAFLRWPVSFQTGLSPSLRNLRAPRPARWPDPRPTTGNPTGSCHERGTAGGQVTGCRRMADRRSGIRRGPVAESVERQGDRAIHPSPEVAWPGCPPRQAPLQAAKSHRDHVRQAQGLAPPGDPPRQRCEGLPLRRRTPALTINVSAAWINSLSTSGRWSPRHLQAILQARSRKFEHP
jgi:hypothetical protein